MKNPKIAIFYDWLNCWGGAERLLLQILKVFPQAKLFSTIHDPSKTNWLPKNTSVKTTYLNKYFQKNTPLLGLLQATAVENLNFSNFDIVISLTSLNGKAIISPPSTLHICYCLTPNRHLHQKKQSRLLGPLIKYLKKNDQIYAHRPDKFLTISKTVQNRIKRTYNLPSILVYPGIDTNKFKPIKTNPFQKYFLIVNRLVAYKKTDIVIKAFKNINDNLFIVGTGPQQQHLQKLAKHNSNIKFLGHVSDQKLITLYQNCQALICPQVEDFGLGPLEAQACGRPVIGLNQAGIAETVISNKTGLLFNQATYGQIQIAIKKFKAKKFNPTTCRQQALKFSNQIFVLNFKKQITRLWRHYQKNQIIIS